jgi:hypothetical protein
VQILPAREMRVRGKMQISASRPRYAFAFAHNWHSIDTNLGINNTVFATAGNEEAQILRPIETPGTLRTLVSRGIKVKFLPGVRRFITIPMT